MLLSEEQRAAVWLSCAEISPKRVEEFKEKYHSLSSLWEIFGSSSAPSFSPAAEAVLKKLHSNSAMEQVINRLEQCHVHLLFREDDSYPEQLRQIDQSPYLLYYAGSLACLKQPAVAIVGSRNPSSYGIEIAGVLAKDLCKAGVCVISGLARGIDAAAHRAAVACDGETIGVLGSGINVPYPQEHIPLLRKIAGGRGLILSEYPLDASPAAYHFPHRNRIISGLSQGVVFVEGKIRSGGMNTVSCALNQGREVFAVPGRVGTECAEGPLTILREGARLVTCADDILEDLGLKSVSVMKDMKKAVFTPIQQSIVNALKNGPISVDELENKTGIDTNAVLTELTIMEIDGLIVRENGNQYRLPID